jgi:hypothetical protein
LLQPGNMSVDQQELDRYDQELMTAVVNRAETIGKEVKPLIMPTNNPLFAIVNTAKTLAVQELILGTSNKFIADDQLEQIAFYWMNVCEGRIEPLTVRLLSSRRDAYLDLGGGNRIPRISERQARSVEELRSAGVGVSRALLVHPGTADGSDLFKAVITMLDSRVGMSVVSLSPQNSTGIDEHSWLEEDVDRALQLRREIDLQTLPEGDPAEGIINLARCEKYDVVILGAPSRFSSATASLNLDYLVKHAPCWVCVVTPTAIPRDVDEDRPLR